MTPQPQPHRHRRFATARRLRIAGLMVLALLSPAIAQDIRGLEVCTAEKQMERRTGCLQSNVEFLQQALAKLTRDTQDKIAAAGRDLAAARAEIAALKSTMAKLSGELAELRAKAEPGNKK
jgi:hypothetical protein